MLNRAGIAAMLTICAGGVETQEHAEALSRIRTEASRNSTVAHTVRNLADRYGPRLTASPELEAAAAWTLSRFQDWGLRNARVERWGPFGRAWSLRRFSVNLSAPTYAPLIGTPLAWSGSTSGRVAAEPVLLPMHEDNLEHFEREIDHLERKFAGKLRGKVVLATSPERLTPDEDPPMPRYTDADLRQEAEPPDSKRLRTFDYTRLVLPENAMDRAEFQTYSPASFRASFRERQQMLRRRLHAFLRVEGAVALLVTSSNSQAGRVAAAGAGWWEARHESPLPVIALTAEHYGRIVRLLEAGETVRLELEVAADISPVDVRPPNVIAELQGSEKAGEWVLAGAHLDSWTGGTGATDNAAGCAIVMEAIRILKAAGLPLARSIRAVLWSGEEQGNFGSEAYVLQNFVNPTTTQPTAEHGRVSAYFNLDDGSGKIRGMYLHGNAAAQPLFERWLAPFRSDGAANVSLKAGGLSDVSSFDAAGVPAFSFIQDPLDYWTHTHHTNIDTLEHVQPADMTQAAMVVAALLYQTANSPEMIPRKPREVTRAIPHGGSARGR